MPTILRIAPLLLVLASLVAVPSAHAVELAIGGYDPVSYHQNQPQKGKAELALIWNDARWQFASQANRTKFEQMPEKYAPQYNGFCAYAASRGYVAEIDPINGWSMRDGKLYFNWSASVKALWTLRANHYIKNGDKNWPTLQEKLRQGNASISRK